MGEFSDHGQIEKAGEPKAERFREWLWDYLFYYHAHRINYYAMCCTSSLNWGFH